MLWPISNIYWREGAGEVGSLEDDSLRDAREN